MKVRSPVLGYNHNVRYAGRLWHVQTEDSGVNNPHVFTHLFHDGTILATKRFDYDPASEIIAVQKLMQQQHKALLRELKAGVYDEKIFKFFGEPVKRDVEETTDPTGKSPIVEMEADIAEDGESLGGPRTDPALRPVPDLPPPRDEPPPIATAATQLALPTPPPMPRVQTPAPMPQVTRPPPARPGSATNIPRAAPGIGARRVAAGSTGARSAEGVVVARPAVIIGGDQGRHDSPPPQPVTPRAPGAPVHSKRWQGSAEPAPPPESKPPTTDNIFGGDLISEKSLDEVILAYLSEDMNDK